MDQSHVTYWAHKAREVELHCSQCSNPRQCRATYCLSTPCLVSHLQLLPPAALIHVHGDHHLRCLGVNVASSFAIIDGEIGPDDIFPVDSECSFNDHVV